MRGLGQGSRNDLEDFEEQGFIERVEGDRVQFVYRGIHQSLLDELTPADVVWAAERMASLSDAQWDDVFRAAGYPEDQRRRYITKIKSKIAEGLKLAKPGGLKALRSERTFRSPIESVTVHVTAIIAAGGRGARLGGAQPKQFLSLGGRPILQRSVEAFVASDRIADVDRRPAAGACDAASPTICAAGGSQWRSSKAASGDRIPSRRRSPGCRRMRMSW